MVITSAERTPSEATRRVVTAVPFPALLAAFVYVVLIGSTARGETDPATRLINTVGGEAVVAILVWRLRSAADQMAVGSSRRSQPYPWSSRPRNRRLGSRKLLP